MSQGSLIIWGPSIQTHNPGIIYSTIFYPWFLQAHGHLTMQSEFNEFSQVIWDSRQFPDRESLWNESHITHYAMGLSKPSNILTGGLWRKQAKSRSRKGWTGHNKMETGKGKHQTLQAPCLAPGASGDIAWAPVGFVGSNSTVWYL